MIIKWLATGVVVVIALWVIVVWPRSRSLPGGYVYTYYPNHGHRYIIDAGGIKKVGQEVLSYHVSDSSITGTVRLSLGGTDVRTFQIDLQTHKVTLGDKVVPSGP